MNCSNCSGCTGCLDDGRCPRPRFGGLWSLVAGVVLPLLCGGSWGLGAPGGGPGPGALESLLSVGLWRVCSIARVIAARCRSFGDHGPLHQVVGLVLALWCQEGEKVLGSFFQGHGVVALEKQRCHWLVWGTQDTFSSWKSKN